MSRSLCEGIEGGNFVGGARCDFPAPPCPACDLLGADNCQLPVNAIEWGGFAAGSISDLTTPPNGTVSADDFIPTQGTLSSVCVWGYYANSLLPNLGCTPSVVDEFRVRVFADNNGVPGAMLGESMVTGPNINRGLEPDTAFAATFVFGTRDITTHGYTLFLDSPITTLVVITKQDPTVHRWQKAWLVQGSATATAATGCQHNVPRQIVAFAAQSVRDPRTHRRQTEFAAAALHHQLAGMVVELIGV